MRFDKWRPPGGGPSAASLAKAEEGPSSVMTALASTTLSVMRIRLHRRELGHAILLCLCSFTPQKAHDLTWMLSRFE